MENIDTTNKGRDLLVVNKPRIFPWGAKKDVAKDPEAQQSYFTYINHAKQEQDQMEKSSYGPDWRQKSIWYVPPSWIINSLKMYKISDKVIHVIEKAMKIWIVELTAGWRSLAETIFATMPHNQILIKFTGGYRLSKSQEKINQLMYFDDIKLFAKKWKRTGNSNTRNQNILLRLRNGIRNRQCDMLALNTGQRHLTDWVELPNLDKIRTLREKETYLGILEADTIKKVEMKEKSRKNISGELESYSQQNYVLETLLKE